MRRALYLSVLVVFAHGCGNSSPDADKQAPNVPEPPSAMTQGVAVPAASLPLAGAPRKNKYLQLAVNEAGFDAAAPTPPSDSRYFTVGLRGISRSTNKVALEIWPFVFAQNDQGCISRPVQNATWLTRPFGSVATFSAADYAQGQLAFLVPEDTQHVRVLITSADGDGFTVAAGEEFTPAWPEAINTIEDGSTLRLLLLPRPEHPIAQPPPAGREHVVLDFVIENLRATQGIEFTTSQQLRLMGAAGSFIGPATLTKSLGCRLDDGDVVPPGQARRFLVVYDVPAGEPVRLQYRGFEIDDVSVDLK